MNSLHCRAGLLILSAILIGLFSDFTLANKFQTIGNGVSGSSQIKIEYLKSSAYIVSGMLLIFSLLALILGQKA